MKFRIIYYITLVCPTLETSLQKVEEYIEHGATALQIDMPSREPIYETPFVAEMMRKALEEYNGYDRFLDAFCEIRKKHPSLELHLVVYPDVVESVGLERFTEFYHEVGFSSLMLVSTDAALRKRLLEAGMTLFTTFSKRFSDEEIGVAATLPQNGVTAVNYRKHAECERTEIPRFADKIHYLRDRGVRANIFAVEGIGTPEMMCEVRDAGTDGALVGNVLMRLWNEPDKLWKLFEDFQSVENQQFFTQNGIHALLGGKMKEFKVIYYITIACPTVERTLKMIDKYVSHGVKSIQIDMPSTDPFAETDFVKKMMGDTLKDGVDYGRYMDAVREIRRRYPALELHLMSYPDVVESIGVERYADFAKEAGVVSLMLCGDMPQERAYFYERGLLCSGHVEYTLPEEQVLRACDPDQRYSLVTMRNARVGQVARDGMDCWENRVRYLRDVRGCPYQLYAVGGILNAEMLREAKRAGVVGAYLGNVLMWNWDDEKKLFEMIEAFEKVAAE